MTAAEPTSPTPWPTRLAPWVVALLALFLLRTLLVAGSGASLHVDEAQYWDWSHALQWGYYSKPPAVALLIGASRWLFGDGELALRLLAMACYPLTALVLAALARDIESAAPAAPAQAVGHAAGHTAGRWAAALFATSPIAGLLGLVATTDALLLLCWALALWSLWHAVALGRGDAWLVFALALGIGLLDKYTMAALLPGAALHVWRHGDRRARIGFALAVTGGLLLWSPNLWWNAMAGWPTVQHTAQITVQSQAGTSGGAAARAGGFAVFALAQLLLLAPLALPWLLWTTWRRRGTAASRAAPAAPLATGARSLLLWTALPLLAVGLLQAARASAEVNWTAPVQLSVAVALGLWLSRRGAAATRTGVLLLLLQALLVSGLGGAPIVQRALAPGRDLPPALDAWARMRGWPQAYATLAPLLPPGDHVTVVGTSRSVLAQAGYQWRGRGVLRAAWAPGGPPTDHYTLNCPWRPGDSSGPIVVLSEGPPPEALAAAMGGLELLGRAEVRHSSRKLSELQLSRAVAPPPPVAGSEARRCR